MSAIEKHVVQIFDAKKRILDQARYESNLWEHHLLPKLILNGIPPPPWLSNSAFHSDPKDLNIDGIVSEGLLSQTQIGIPFTGRQCSLYSNLDVVSDVQHCDEIHGFKKDRDMGGRLSNLPDCSVNNAGCASSGHPELDSDAISPQNQIEPRPSESCHDPEVSRVKLQRSRSRQKALELRNSAKASKRLSGDGDNAGDCTAAATGSASPSLREDHIKELSLVNEFHPNNQSCLIEEVRRGDYLTQKDPNSNYTGRITRSKSSSEKINSLSVGSSSVEKEDGPPSNDLNGVMELVNRASCINGSCGVQEPNIEFQNKEVESSVYDKRLTKPRSSSQAEHNSELLNLDSTSGRYKVVEASDLKQPCSHVELTGLTKTSDCGVVELVNRASFINGSCGVQEPNIEFRNKEVESSVYDKRLTKPSSSSQAEHNSELLNLDSTSGRYKVVKASDLKQPCSHVELADLTKTSDCISGSKRNIVQDDDFCQTKQENNIQNRLRLHRSSYPSPGDDFFTTGGSVKSIDKSVQLLQPLISKNLQDPSAAVVGSLGSQKEPHTSAVKTKEQSSRSGSGKAYLTRSSKLSKSLNSNSCEQSATHFESAGKKSQNVQPTKLDPTRLSSISVNSAEKENIAGVAASRNTRSLTSFPKEGPLRSARSSNLDGGGSLHADSLYIKIAVAEKDLDGLIDKDPSCLVSRLTTVSPKVREDVAILRSSPDFVMSVMPKQLVFDDGEGTNSDGISSPDVKGHQRMSPDKESLALSEPLKLLNDDMQEVRGDSYSEAVTENGLPRHTDKSVTKLNDRFPLGSPTDESNVDLAQHAPITISSGQNGDFHNFKSSTDSFTNDVEHSCSQHKRRKIEIETEKFLPDTTHLGEKLVDSIDQRPASGSYFAFDQADDIGQEHVSNIPTDVMEDTGESQKMEGSSCKVRKEEKLILDGRGRSSDSLMLPEAIPFSFIDLPGFAMEENGGSQHVQVNSGQDIVEHLTCVERSTSSRIIYPRGDTESSGLQDFDLIGTGEALPEFEGFLMQTDNEQSCTAPDKMELEIMNLPSNSVEYTSHGRSRFMHSPLCYSSTPYKLDSLENLYQSLPNGLLEGYGLRTGSPLNDGRPRALSDCQPKCNDQFRSSVQTLWDRFNSNFGSSGKRRSSKPELPCISEENENVEEIAGTFHKDIGSEGMTGSIMRGPLAVIVNNANPSTSVLQDALASGREDLLNSEFNLDGTNNKVKKKLDKQDGDRTRFTSKGKDNHSISLGANGAKRNSESVRKGSSRPKLSKDSMKQQRPTFSGGKSTRKNIVSNVTSFIPMVQQKQAAAGLTGKRDIKVVKALKAAAAAKDAAEKIENERKRKREEQLERMKKKKEEERKKEAEMPAKKRLRENEEKKKEEERKKEAEMPARKRQRENEEKKENQRKTKHVNEMKKQEKKKEDSKVHWRATGEEVCENRTIMDGRDNHNNMLLQENRQGNAEKNSEPEPLTIRDSPNNTTKERCREKSESVSECANKGKESMVDLIKDVEDNDLIIKNSLQEQSYEMSPYRSDDDEDEDDMPNHKFIPSWASKHSLSLIVSSQKVDPQTIFPRQSFCDIAKVLLPRKLQL
ncbi:unnamed protein product [Trifolium pratense]|uniref:Uncharacterized protein n=1 Tax=Trifolium pratense TaxID=57577 RepID=A0ACB0IFV7_TRIPR|nr:unnamed protein product [Trifolium pratense]